MKVGILGGTFNPIHKGHLAIAFAGKKMGLDEVWFLPAGDPPHKAIEGDASTSDRINMVRLAIKDLPWAHLIFYETRILRKSYSYETLRDLKEHFPADELYFLIGGDSLRDFPTWRHPEEIVKYAAIVSFGRGETRGELRVLSEKMEEEYGGTFLVGEMDPVHISSTKIREGDIDPAFLHKDVYSYIIRHGLYRRKEAFGESLEEIDKDLKKRLKPSRYRHTQGVMYTAAALAMRWGYPMEKALCAGLLHDSAKYLSNEELLSFSKKKGIPVTEMEEKAPHLLHAKVGAYFARERYGVRDAEILHAIRVHTTGEPNMGLLDKILFTADYIEPSRDKAANLLEIRSEAFMDLDLALAKILRDTLIYLKSRKQEIDPETEETYEFYSRIIEEKKWTKEDD